jgi:hypothetical protein
MTFDRTPAYWMTTATLVLAYVVGVAMLQGLFRALTGQESQLAVVVSTLIIAVLLDPPRRRIQSFIDRQFHRRNLERRSRS